MWWYVVCGGVWWWHVVVYGIWCGTLERELLRLATSFLSLSDSLAKQQNQHEQHDHQQQQQQQQSMWLRGGATTNSRLGHAPMVAPSTGQHSPGLTDTSRVTLVPQRRSTRQLLAAARLLLASHFKLCLEVIRLETNTDQLTGPTIQYGTRHQPCSLVRHQSHYYVI